MVLGPLLLTLHPGPVAAVPVGQRGPARSHPVQVAWKDRTWWTGGAALGGGPHPGGGLLFAWFHKVAAGVALARLAPLLTPARLRRRRGRHAGAGAWPPAPCSPRCYDGRRRSLGLVVLAMVAVAATQVWAYLDGGRAAGGRARPGACAPASALVGAAVVFVGPEVWTTSWSRYDLGGAMGRSLVMAVLITVLQVTTSILAAYAFVFLRFPFKRMLFALFMATLLLPLEVTLVGNVATIRQLEWINTLQALVLPFGATALGTFLIRQGFRGLPTEIQDATRLDGYGHVAFLTKFAVPLTRPVIASFTVISALQAWNQYLWPRAVITANELNTLQIQLRQVAAGEVGQRQPGHRRRPRGLRARGVLLIAFQRQIIRGLTAGAVK